MEYILTNKAQLSKRGMDGKSRNYMLYFLNGVEILKQKIPFDINFDKGFDRRVGISNEYILNGRMHQTREVDDKVRYVSFPLSRQKLAKFSIDKDLKININNMNIEELTEVRFSNVEGSEYPEFCDAYISYAKYDGKELTDGEYELINNQLSNIDIWKVITQQ